jgi:hypothetical protein
MSSNLLDRYPRDESERRLWEAECLEQKRIQSYDDVSSIDINLEQLLEIVQASRLEQERTNAEVQQLLKHQDGQRAISNILLALILAVLAYQLF